MRSLYRHRVVRAAALFAAATFTASCSDGPSGPSTPPVTTGSLVLSTAGLPVTHTPTFAITTADGVVRVVAGTDTVRNLTPGLVTIRPAQPSVAGVGRWVPEREEYSATIVVALVTNETVRYASAPIVLLATAEGLPPSTTATMRFTAPDGTAYSVTAGTPFLAPVAGQWTLTGQALSANNFTWQPVDAPIARVVVPGDTASATIPFGVASGAIEITASGLGGVASPSFTISRGTTVHTRVGPGLFPDLAPGTWQLSTGPVSISGSRFAPAVVTQPVDVTLGVLTDVPVSFTATPIKTNFWVEGAYFTQAIQTFDGSAALVAERDALLRVFLRANEPNNWRPMVRARVYNGTTLVQTIDMPASSTGVDTIVSEGVLARSWNVRVSAAHIVPGLRVLIDADPGRAITADDDESDNVWPRNGSPQPVAVTRVSTWRTVLVPVVNVVDSVTTRTGNVTEANKRSFTELAERLMPIAGIDARVRAPYTANVGVLQSGDGNRAWTSLLSEINALRAVEGVAGEYWYGVVKVSYSSGIAGYGFVPGRAAVGWDYLPGGARVAAHEWGHNFGRPHAPCGNVGNADSQYPHAGGVIGAWGWNSATNALVSPTATDVMGYCGNQWISAHNWTRALNYRGASINALEQPSEAALQARDADRLLVWGTVRDGRIEVEPAFVLDGAGSGQIDAASESDQWLRIDALDADRRVVATTIAPAPKIDHNTNETRAFATTLQVTPAQQAAIVSLRVHDVRSPLAAASRDRSRAAQVASAVTAARSAASARVVRSGDRLRVQWDTTQFPRAMVRDAASGRVLSILRASSDLVVWRGGAVDITMSDGVQSTTRRVTP
jgi:hypothetical protein